MDLLYRFAILILLLAAIAWIDWRQHRAAATKWREYTFLLAAGFLGGLVGILTDNLTVSISPDYFIWGKGIAADDGFRLRVTLLGLHAGFLAGVVVGGICLIANKPKPDRAKLSAVRLLGFAARPLLGGLVLAPIISLLTWHFDPMGFAAEFRDLLDASQAHRFALVWGMHLGMYAGGLLGLLWGFTGIRRRRITTAKTLQTPKR
jgi:hypothetical protein